MSAHVNWESLHLPIKFSEPLASHTTFRIGGPADAFVQVTQVSELIECVRWARQNQVAFFILGNGSNLLVRDGGIRGLVIANRCDAVALNLINSNTAWVSMASGVLLPGIANRLSRLGWTGLEWAIGVPGTLGGAIVGNAGAHGASMSDHLIAVQILETDNAVRWLPKTDCAFNYRTSRFKRMKRDLVLQADLELRRDDPQTCIARMNQYAEQRRRTQPTQASVGSMFKNPPGDYAGRLIEQAGLKGARVGAVQVSEMHANFFVNHGGTRASDVSELIELVRARVREKFGIELELEIEIVGE